MCIRDRYCVTPGTSSRGVRIRMEEPAGWCLASHSGAVQRTATVHAVRAMRTSRRDGLRVVFIERRFIPHPALRATLSRRERDNSRVIPSPSGRGWPEGPGEGAIPTLNAFPGRIHGGFHAARELLGVSFSPIVQE